MVSKLLDQSKLADICLFVDTRGAVSEEELTNHLNDLGIPPEDKEYYIAEVPLRRFNLGRGVFFEVEIPDTLIVPDDIPDKSDVSWLLGIVLLIAIVAIAAAIIVPIADRLSQ